MAFTKMTDDLNIIQKLPNLPNDVGGLSADQLKAEYDEAGILLKKYINERLIPELEGTGGAANIGISPVEGVNATTIQRALEILRGQLVEATAGVIPDGAITSIKLASDAVTTNKIADSAVTAAKVADGAITDNKIAGVSASKISGNISNIADGAVGTNKLENFSVTTAKIGGGAVTEEKIGVGAVVESKIKSGAVTNTKIADKTIEREKLADKALSSPVVHINSSKDIDTSHLGKTLLVVASGAVTLTMSSDVNSEFELGTEIAIVRYSATSLSVVLQGVRVAVALDKLYGGKNGQVTIKVEEPYGMIALKKVSENSTTGDLWYVSGNVEVVT